jgi:hypothetical protein
MIEPFYMRNSFYKAVSYWLTAFFGAAIGALITAASVAAHRHDWVGVIISLGVIGVYATVLFKSIQRFLISPRTA